MATQRPNATLPGIVEMIVESPHPSGPDKAQIAIEGADDLYRKLRIDNTLKDENGGEVSLKPGAQVQVTSRRYRPQSRQADANKKHLNRRVPAPAHRMVAEMVSGRFPRGCNVRLRATGFLGATVANCLRPSSQFSFDARVC